MMTGNDLKIFLKFVYFSNCFYSQLITCNFSFLVEQLIARGETKALFVCDSWSSNLNNDTWEGIRAKYADQIYLEKRIIPAGATGDVQPLDVFYFRQWKDYVRKITDSIEIEQKMWQRDNFIKLQSVTHYQFQARQFQDMVKFAWFHAGLVEERPPRFDTPAEVCLFIYYRHFKCNFYLGMFGQR